MRDEHADACKCPRCSGKIAFFAGPIQRRLMAPTSRLKNGKPVMLPVSMETHEKNRLAATFSHINPTC
jgi:hypothetical protein